VNAQAALVPFIQRNLEVSEWFAKLPDLSFSSSPEAIINRVKSWLVPVIRDYIGQAEPGEYLDTQSALAVGEDPPYRVIPVPLEAFAYDHHNALVDRWLDALQDLRIHVQTRTANLKPTRAIAIWICAAALTAVAGIKPGMLVVPHITQPDAEDVVDRQKVALRLSVETIERLPLHLASWAAAVAVVESRIGAYITDLRDRKLNKASHRSALKQLIYYTARHDQHKAELAENASRGLRLLKKMQHVLVSKGFARDVTDADQLLRRAHILPEELSDQANDFQTYWGSVRVNALVFIALKRNGLMRPAVFRTLGPSGKLTDIVLQLRKEGVLVDEILALCGPEHEVALAAKEKT
jgi:hypothetical protein